MITSEQITKIVNEAVNLNMEIKYASHIAQLQYDIKQLLIHQSALTDKIHYLQKRVDDPQAEQDQYDAVGEHRADKILNHAFRYSDLKPDPHANPIMDRQEYPEGMREWEIVEFKEDGSSRIFIIFPDKRYGSKSSTVGVLNLSDMLSFGCCVNSGHWHIHSVRRLSDGEVFTVGDRATLTGKENSPVIKKFEILDGKMCAVFFDILYDISLLIKVGESSPSFTTADGAVVLEGYNIWFMHPEKAPVPTFCKAVKGLNWDNHYSTKEAAEAAYKAAVLFTTVDGVDVFAGDNIYMYQQDGRVMYDTARAGSGGLWYSTHAAAEAAYNKWLYEQPVLTLAFVKATAHLSAVELVELEEIVKNAIDKS